MTERLIRQSPIVMSYVMEYAIETPDTCKDCAFKFVHPSAIGPQDFEHNCMILDKSVTNFEPVCTTTDFLKIILETL